MSSRADKDADAMLSSMGVKQPKTKKKDKKKADDDDDFGEVPVQTPAAAPVLVPTTIIPPTQPVDAEAEAMLASMGVKQPKTKKKDKKKADDDDDFGEIPVQTPAAVPVVVPTTTIAPTQPVDVEAEAMLASMGVKQPKNKKKDKKKEDDDDFGDVPTPVQAVTAPAVVPAVTSAPTAKPNALDAEADAMLAALGIAGGGAAKKKKDKKKTTAGDASVGELVGEGESAPAEEEEDMEEEEVGALATTASKNKKKKKPAAVVEEKKPAAAPLSRMAKLALEEQARQKKLRDEQARLEQEETKRQEEEERQEQERMRLELEEKERKRKKKLEKKSRLEAEGKPVTKAEKEKVRELERQREYLIKSGMVTVPQPGSGSVLDKPKEKKKSKTRKPIETTSKSTESAVEVKNEVEESEDEDWDVMDTEKKLKNLQMRALASSEQVGIKAEKPQIAAAGVASEKKEKKEKLWKKETKENKKATKAESSSDEDSEDEDEDSEDSEVEDANGQAQERRARIQAARAKRLERMKKAKETAIKECELRSPIVCVLGHVDVGKTKILDMLRKTNVQEGEAGGITQQIGATTFPATNLQIVTDRLPAMDRVKYLIPGLQIIDTPGHEAFANLRSRGSSLADVAILLVDIMHGLEPQTIESIELLKKRNTRFVVALNKVDRLYNWKSHPGMPIRLSLNDQPQNVEGEFRTRVKTVVTQLMEQGLNSRLYWENTSMEDTVNICPTSAITGEGSPDLIATIVRVAQEQLKEKISYSRELECTVLEVKKIEGLGTTIDVCLVNGELRDSDTLVLATAGGPLVTKIRSLLTPQPMREMRVKNDYIIHKSIKGATSVKVTCHEELENVVAGTSVFIVSDHDDLDELKDAVMKDVSDNLGDISTVERGVFVQASTLGSLEALMVHLRKEKVPVAGVAVGPIRKKDVTRASAMLENKAGVDPDFFESEYGSVLGFNVKVDQTAVEMADDLGIKIFTDETIYNLTDQYLKYVENIKTERKKRAIEKAVFPCIVKIITGNVFNNKNPLVLGVDVMRGSVRLGTPIVVPEKMVEDLDNPGQKLPLYLGKVVGIEKNRVPVDKANRGDKVCIKIQGGSNEANIQVGRQFEESNQLVSWISRKSIDVLKHHFKEEVDALKEEGWAFIQNDLKKTFKIV